ncbi:MAG: rhomboid family intramembrane serine protease [Hyphomicrobiaceae bacterium]
MLFIPLSDDNPLRFVHRQWVTIGIIAVNVIVYVLQFSGLLLAAGSALSVVPAELLQVRSLTGSARGSFDAIAVPEVLTLLTYMFLHVDVLHLASNMMFLWVFGDNVEDAMGHLRYLAFYLLCGIAAALTQALMMPSSQLPLIGASGAVAGTIAAYLILHPRVLVWVLAFRVLPLRITAAWILGVWVATQLFMVLINRGDQVAWWAHIGGLAAGAALIPLMRRASVPLFDRGATPIDTGRDAWWREHQAAIFHRGLMRLRNPLRWLASLGRYFRAAVGRYLRAARSLMQRASATNLSGGAPASATRAAPTRRTTDLLRFEPRGENFALVRTQADGTRSEIVLTDANVVHLGLLAPGFAREVLVDKIGQQPQTMSTLVRHRVMNANLRLIELLITILDKGGGRFDFPATERRARALASKLVERADRIAKAPRPAGEPR